MKSKVKEDDVVHRGRHFMSVSVSVFFHFATDSNAYTHFIFKTLYGFLSLTTTKMKMQLLQNLRLKKRI